MATLKIDITKDELNIVLGSLRAVMFNMVDQIEALQRSRGSDAVKALAISTLRQRRNNIQLLIERMNAARLIHGI